MNANDTALANITAARTTVADGARSRASSLVATKLEEAQLWLETIMPPEPVSYELVGDVLVATLTHGSIRVELVGDDRADCALLIDGETPVRVTVMQPHDRGLRAEAGEVMAAIYWSRARAMDGKPPGQVVVSDRNPR